MQKLACGHGLAPEGFLSQLQIVLLWPRKRSPTSLMKSNCGEDALYGGLRNAQDVLQIQSQTKEKLERWLMSPHVPVGWSKRNERCSAPTSQVTA